MGGPVKHDKTFFFLSWEEFKLRQAIPLLTTVPTVAMRNGNFTGLPDDLQSVHQPAHAVSEQHDSGIDDRSHSEGVAWILGPPERECRGGQLRRQRANGIESVRICRDALTTPSVTSSGSLAAIPTGTERHNPITRSSTQSGTSATLYHTHQAVAGDTYTFSPTLLGDFRASYMRTVYSLLPASTGKADLRSMDQRGLRSPAKSLIRRIPFPRCRAITRSGTWTRTIWR